MPKISAEVKWGEDNNLDAAPTLSEEELSALKSRMQAMDKILATAQKAKFKVEVMFSSHYSMHQPFPGAISFWESGTKLHGGGDTKIYECPARDKKTSDCDGFIPDASVGYGHLVCPKCMKVWKGDEVYGERLARLSVQNWSLLIFKFFVRLEHNADIYLKRPRLDIRRAAEAEQVKQLKGDKLRVARTSLETCVYPLKNIIKDTAGGADIVKRFRAFLSS